MNIEYLRNNYYKLISHMEENGYSQNYINKFRREINRIISLAPLKKWSSYADIYTEYTESTTSLKYLRKKRSMLGAIEQFELFKRYPDGRRKEKLFPNKYDLLSSEFKSIIDNYSEFARQCDRKASTIKNVSNHASTFLFSFQEKGVETLDEIKEEDVLEFFISPDGTILRGRAYKNNIAIALKASIPFFPQGHCSKVISFLPAIPKKRKNIQYLTSGEIEKIKITLNNSSLTLRDKTIGTLVLYTGLRCCDIARMTLNSINWEKDLIQIKQQKTNEPLELPLTAIVGNSIHDYITKERPKVDISEIFLSQRTPYRNLQSCSVSHIADKIMMAANIRQEEGERKGFHIFRYHVATALLENGIPQPVISRVLGHTSPKSLDSYLRADFSHLKECSLSVECFPLHKGVFL